MANTGLALFTYCRPDHTRKVLESLKNNDFKKIYIFQDGLKNKKDEIAWKEVSDIIKDVDFIEKEVHISQINRGLANSIITGVNYVFEKHETVIALEDDVVLSKGYSRFMDACFEKYKNDERITCVAGGGWPVDIPEAYGYDAFYSYRASSIAWGTWKNRWKHYNRDFGIMQRIMSDEEKKTILMKSGGDITTIIKAQLFGECDSWAVFWTLLQIDLKGVCVLPSIYLAKDVGHDGVFGTNSTLRTIRYDAIASDLPDDKLLNLPDNVVINEDINKQIKMILDVTDRDNRKVVTERVLGKWVDMYLRGGSIASYLTQNNIKQIYIYGAGVLAKKVINEIKNQIVIKGIIVLDKTIEEFYGYPVYGIQDDFEFENEYTVITPVHDLEYIRYIMKKRFDTEKLLSLEDIVGCDEQKMEG